MKNQIIANHSNIEYAGKTLENSEYTFICNSLEKEVQHLYQLSINLRSEIDLLHEENKMVYSKLDKLRATSRSRATLIKKLSITINKLSKSKKIKRGRATLSACGKKRT